MAKKKITRTFPETEPRGLEEEPFRSHLADMLGDYVAFIARRELTYRPRTVVRPHKGGMRWSDMPFPSYPRWLERAEEREALRLPGVTAFFEYVWDRGELRRGFTGSDPQRSTWEQSLLHELLHVPLMGILSEYALRQAVETGDIPDPWTLSTESTDIFLNELVRRHVYGRQTYVARCPLAWFGFGSREELDFGHGMRLRKYMPLEKALYLSRNNNRILWSDTISQLMSNEIAVLEINDEIEAQIVRKGGYSRFDGRVTGADLIKEHLADVIDVAKWALATVTSKYPPPIEGAITFDSILGDSLGGLSGGSFRREDKSSGTSHEVSEDELRSIQNLISLALKYREVSEDIRRGLWYWGKACVADLSRDRLLESVLGLEPLLIQGHEQLRYKFSLHGAALLANCAADARARFGELQKIYDRRSSAAHGRGASEVHAYARMAHKAFGDALRIILLLFEARQLSPRESVAKQIQDLVVTNAWIQRAEDL